MKDLGELIKEIDAKIEEIKNDPSYNEEEGKEQLRKMQDYIKEHPEVKSEYERLITEGGSWYNAEYYKKTYPTIEQYIKNKVSFVPFAILMPDGVWYEKGRMGWFGMSSETFDESIEWYENFYDRFIKDYQDYYVTLIDCHI